VAVVVVRAEEVLEAGLAGDVVLAGDAVPFTADVTLLAGAAVTVRLVVVVVVVVVVFFTVDVAADTAGLVAGLVVVGGAAAAAALGAVGLEAGAAGVAFLNGDNLVGRAGFGESADVLASVVAARLHQLN
jgi:hypothetical protein